LSDSILASYLLALDNTQAENQKIISQRLKAEFADEPVYTVGDDNLNLKLRFNVPPEEAIDYFKRKKIVTKKEFDKLSRQAKAGAFYVSGVYKKDILTAFHQEITDALESGQTLQKTTKGFKDILDGAGHRELGDFHLETVVRSNMMTAYGVGQRRAMEDVAEDLPLWEYSAVGDDRTRPTHRALDGAVFPANHSFWDEHFPPWGFNCRCSVIARFDYPENYNHRKPNKDTTIAYDEKGLPAKAEYLNQVVDLKATKFVGVPRVAQLDEVLQKAAERAQAARRERDTYKTPDAIIEKAKEIRNEKVEIVHLFDVDGNHLFSGRGKSDRFEMDVPDDIAKKYVGGIDVHNHPPEAGRSFESFSPDDIANAIEWELKETLVITKKYLYSMRPPKTGWDKALKQKISDAYLEFNVKVINESYESFKSGEFTIGEIKDIIRHKVWNLVAKELGLRYKRKRI